MRTVLVRDMFAAHLRERCGFAVPAVSAFPNEAVKLCQRVAASMLMLEHFPSGSTREIITSLQTLRPPVPVIVYSVNAADLAGLDAAGCLTGDDDVATLDEAVSAVANGGKFSSSSCHLSRNEKLKLTDRQQEVLSLIVHGATTKEVAAALRISVKTADHHRTRLMKRLKAHHLAELIRIALDQGLAELR